jgi:hypothetical protein
MQQIKPIMIVPTEDKYALYLSDGEAVSVIFECPYCGVTTQTVWLCPDTPMPIFGLRCCGENGIIFPVGWQK